MPSDSVTGKIKTMAKKPVVTWTMVSTMVLGQAGGVAWGIKKVEEAEAKADSANTVAMATQKAVEVVSKNTDLILQVMLAQGKVVVDTVKVPVMVVGADTLDMDTVGTGPR